jgi:hypothetical protein
MPNISEADPFYFFNIIKGKIILSGSDLPKRKASIYMVIKRENLFFNDLLIKTKKKIKSNDILEIQKNHIPFKNNFLNLIYCCKKKKASRFFYWVGRVLIEKENLVYDEIPESFIFKGDPQKVKNYNLFLFKRISGFEIIYFDGEIFYSAFEKDLLKVHEKINLLARKFSSRGKIKILSEIELNGIVENYNFDLIDDKERNIFLPSYFNITKIFSNTSRDKDNSSLFNLVKLAGKFSNFFLVANLLILILLVLFNLYLKNDRKLFNEKFAGINEVLGKANLIEFKLNNFRKQISLYPDHLLYLKIISDSIDADSLLNEISINRNKIILKGFSKNSLLLLNNIGNNKYFKKVKFKNPVTKGVYSKKERFVIEIEL